MCFHEILFLNTILIFLNLCVISRFFFSAHCEKAEKEKKEDRRRNSLSSPEVNPPSTTVEMETECDLAQGPKSSLNNGGGLPSLEAAATDAATVNLISTKQMFKPKKNKSKRKASEILEGTCM